MVIGGCGVALGLHAASTRTYQQAFEVLRDPENFHWFSVLSYSDTQQNAAEAVHLQTASINERSTGAFQAGVWEAFDEFTRNYQRTEKRAPQLRETPDNYFEYKAAVCDSRSPSYVAVPGAANLTATAVFVVLSKPNSDRPGFLPELDQRLYDFRDRVELVLDTSRKATRRIVAVSVVLCTVSLCLLFAAFLRIANESATAIAAQDRLAHQQAHENRNLYSPAIDALRTIVNGDDVPSEDLRVPLLLLEQVEAQHTARLHTYAVLRGKYRPNLATFDLLCFLTDKACSEAALARMSDDSTTFAVRVCPPLDGRDEFRVQADKYCLDYVVSNLLSNARRHCREGEVVVEFKGVDDHQRLAFAVTDHGEGIPEEIRPTLFAKGVVTGDVATGNVRSQFGLPSCAIFCEHYEGYIRLARTRCADDLGKGLSVFEFAISGTVLPPSSAQPDDDEAADTQCDDHNQSSAVPDALKVVVVDDQVRPPESFALDNLRPFLALA